MVQPHDASGTLPRWSTYCERGWLFAGAVFAICAVITIPARSGVTSESVPESAVPQVAVVPPGAATVAATPPGATDVALVKPADAKPQPSSEQQRQLMLLLLMNSAGPVRPFGGLGR